MRTAVLLASLVLLGAAQDPQRQPPPTFKSGVQLVEVDVRVFDRDGRFLADLSRDDFELIEDGAPQKIDAMYLVGVDRPSGVTTPDPAGILPSAPGANTPGPAAPQTWIFFFDLNHLTPGGGFDRARKAVEDYIRDGFRDGDIGGIVAGEKMVNNRLTSVHQELLEAVAQVKPRTNTRTRLVQLTREWPRFLDEEEAIRVARFERDVVARVVGRACSDDPNYCEKGDPEPLVRSKGLQFQEEIHRDSNQSLASINALSSGLARIAGPKTVVLLSDGFVVQDIETTVRSVVGQTARAGARIYAIDVRGLARAGNPGIIDQAQTEDTYSAVTRFDSLADGTNSLAIDTGGLMIRNENNIGRALGRIAEDASRYYVLAYQPANSNFDGKYRPIQVRVKRDGVRVRARRGYLALPPARMLIPQAMTSRAEEPAASAPQPEPAAAPAPRPEPATAHRTEPAALQPVDALPPPATATIAEPAPETPAAMGAAVRLRPDTASRVKALSARDTTGSSVLVRDGWDAYQRGDVETAETAFAKAAAQADVRPWVLYALGMTQAALGRAPAAIASWERVREAVPDFEPVYMDLADTYAQVSDMTKALAVIRDAEKRWPRSADIQSAIGVILVRRGALDDGVAALEQATRLAPDDGLAHLNLGRAYAQRFHRGRRYVTSQRRWVAPEADRTKALDAFTQCVKIGGPYARHANEERALLEWSK